MLRGCAALSVGPLPCLELGGGQHKVGRLTVGRPSPLTSRSGPAGILAGLAEQRNCSHVQSLAVLPCLNHIGTSDHLLCSSLLAVSASARTDTRTRVGHHVEEA